MSFSRRDLLKLGAAAVGGAALAPSVARAQTPKRGGTLACACGIPPTSTRTLTISYKITSCCPFTHSRLREAQGRARRAAPGTFPIEGDLAESWTPAQRDDLHLQAAARRALAQQAARERPRADRRRRQVHHRPLPHRQGQRQRLHAEAASTRSRRVDKYTVKFTLKEPYAWFLDMLANPMAVAIVAKEASRSSATSRSPSR